VQSEFIRIVHVTIHHIGHTLFNGSDRYVHVIHNCSWSSIVLPSYTRVYIGSSILTETNCVVKYHVNRQLLKQ